MTLSAEQKTTFDEKGFIVLKEFVDSGAIGVISDWLDVLQDVTSETSAHAAKYFEKSPLTGENILVRVEHVLGEYDAEISELLLNAK
ncbi:MAG: hypothetical protein QGH93_10490, partial [Gammaproteobacteria bacterium]|nr:hypothetical protein [Gammaproteobacteria bacterium]